MLSVALALAALQDPQVVDGVIVRPQWVEGPGVERLTPDRGRDPRTDYTPVGEVRLRCVVVAEGRVDDCVIIAQPTQYPELGSIALGAARSLKHADQLENGAPSAGMPVVVSFRWSLPAD